MIRNYLKIAIRNLMRHKGYTAINILGLGIGLACFMIIITYVNDELSFDKWHLPYLCTTSPLKILHKEVTL